MFRVLTYDVDWAASPPLLAPGLGMVDYGRVSDQTIPTGTGDLMHVGVRIVFDKARIDENGVRASAAIKGAIQQILPPSDPRSAINDKKR